MTTKSKAKSRILDAVHETAGDLYRLGFIDQRKMRKSTTCCASSRSRSTTPPRSRRCASAFI
ncbi:MAG TPA: hypothetical protein VMR06_12865 [Dokdonella sp.]|uniref:hypothetical protein n=1 Tax=Dokdonella sp. TaxID=2291710 RepID=UPI002BBF598A|nr:hypothetical protein [Dokdonella sp.]HUD42875.1 hypothetical protein [Dokdonella sp.]